MNITQEMDALRERGWLVVLKTTPSPGWIVDGARSEYDAPCEDTVIGQDKRWCCEAAWHGDGPYRRSAWAVGKTAEAALSRVIEECDETDAAVTARAAALEGAQQDDGP